MFEKEILNDIYKFVSEELNKRGKGSSHGMEHVDRVINNTLEISYNLNLSNNKKFICKLVATIHDYADSKYDSSGELQKKLREKLLSIPFADKDIEDTLQISSIDKHKFVCWILAITERISFSREKKLGKNDWEEEIGKDGILIRNIVSDADKMDASGAAGYARCQRYTMELYPREKYDQKEYQKIVYTHVRDHCRDKLFHLESYMYTNYGKEKMKNLQNELVEAYLYNSLEFL